MKVLLLLVVSVCNGALFSHVYHSDRLQVHQPCVSLTGVTIDASHGKHKTGCRSEADGDLHCWIRLDPGQESFLNQGNLDKQEGNLVYEPMCQHRVTQADAKAVCHNWKQKLVIPPIGSHVRVTGAFVTDLQHGHNEIHPVTSIEVIP